MFKWRKRYISVIVAILLMVGAGLYIVDQSDFDMEEQTVEIQSPQGKLTGRIQHTQPNGEGWSFPRGDPKSGQL